MGMKFAECSKCEAMSHRSRQLFWPLFVEPSIEPPLVPWNELKTNYGTYPAASRTRVTREAVRMPRLCLNLWMRFNPLSLIAR